MTARGCWWSDSGRAGFPKSGRTWMSGLKSENKTVVANIRHLFQTEQKDLTVERTTIIAFGVLLIDIPAIKFSNVQYRALGVRGLSI